LRSRDFFEVERLDRVLFLVAADPDLRRLLLVVFLLGALDLRWEAVDFWPRGSGRFTLRGVFFGAARLLALLSWFRLGLLAPPRALA
jgi:hypothetical protein